MNWNMKIRLSDDLAYPSIIGVQIFQVLSGKQGMMDLKAIVPDPLGDDDNLDGVYEYECIVETGLEKDEFIGLIKEIRKEIKGIKTVTLQKTASVPEKTPVSQANGNGNSLEKQEDSGASRVLASSYIRIGLEKVEQLVNLIGELIITKSQVDMLSHRIIFEKDGSHGTVLDYESARNQLDLVTQELRDVSLGIRMVPVSSSFAKFPAMIREISRKQKKEVNFIVLGENTEVDKAILEVLSDPLVHILRNSVDHGLEEPSERKRAGKKEEGNILLEAYYEGDSIFIVIEDDGRGLDIEKISAKALEKNLISKEELSGMTEKEIISLIFRPGFSTAAEVTDISGRGVGMDVVRSSVESINGSIEIDSEKGVGSRITIKLPMTLSIVDSLLIQDEEQVYAIPLVSIGRVNKITKESINQIGNYSLVNNGDYSIPSFPVNALFGEASFDYGDEEIYLVETIHSGGRFGLLVSNVLGQQEIVIKSLGEYLGNVSGVSGGTILGDGTVALILDVKSFTGRMTEFKMKEGAL